MPQISKALLSDAMYCVNELAKIIKEEAQDAQFTDELKQEYLEADLKWTVNVLNQLRALYEAPRIPHPSETMPED